MATLATTMAGTTMAPLPVDTAGGYNRGGYNNYAPGGPAGYGAGGPGGYG